VLAQVLRQHQESQASSSPTAAAAAIVNNLSAGPQLPHHARSYAGVSGALVDLPDPAEDVSALDFGFDDLEEEEGKDTARQAVVLIWSDLEGKARDTWMPLLFTLITQLTLLQNLRADLAQLTETGASRLKITPKERAFSLELQQTFKVLLTQVEGSRDSFPQQVLGLLHSLDLLQPIMSWLCRQNSESHIDGIYAVKELLLQRGHEWLPLAPSEEESKITDTAQQGLQDVLAAVVNGLQFLAAVSPNRGVQLKVVVRAAALECLTVLHKLKVLSAEEVQPPFFGQHHCSPIFQAMQTDLLTTLLTPLNSSRRAQLSSIQNFSLHSGKLSEMQLFSMIGDHGSTLRHALEHKAAVTAKHDELQRLLSRLLQTPWVQTPEGGKRPALEHIISIENITALHRLVTFAPDTDNKHAGKPRTLAVVGSFQYYKTYTVFMPHEEITRALEVLVQACHSEPLLRAHACTQAYYILSALLWYIHPFEDGNGRVARLLCNIVLRNAGFGMVVTYKDKILTLPNLLQRVARNPSVS
jgi:hypothetical protein